MLKGDLRVWPVILSGGVGSRLWPLSRVEQPKQLLPLAGADTMIQATARRVADPARFHPPVVVANAVQAEAIAAQLEAAGLAPAELIVEPEGRNTAPAIALAARRVAAAADAADALMLVMPSDHVITDVAAFLGAVAAALPAAAEGWLVTFGIHANAPETGYGYIRLGELLGPAGNVRRVDRFVEKPALETAREYVRSGGYAWNGGLFLMRADRYLVELERHAPAIHAATQGAVEAGASTGGRFHPDAARFAACPSDSIDYAVMERAGRVAVVPVDMGWSDIGSWDALRAVASDRADADGTVSSGDVIAVGSRGCLLRSEGPLIAAVGLEAVTVVATRDAVLVAARGRTQEVKAVVDRLNAAGRPETIRHAGASTPAPAPTVAAPEGWAVRLYRATDREAALMIFDSNTPEYFAASERDDYEAQLDRPDGPAFVITRAGRAIAYGGYETGELYNRCYLNWGMAARELHGRGIGSALLWARIAHLLEHAPQRRWLAVDTIPAVAPFFERNGFERLPDWRGGYTAGFDMAQLRLELGDLTAEAARARAEAALAHAAARG